MKKVTLTRKELEDFAIHGLGITQAALRRMSTQFLAQLLQLKMNGETRALQMVNELRCLENLHREMSCYGNNNKVSGAWIVFKRHNGTNYYLTMAKPDEGDHSINQRVRDAYEFDFPFLRESQWTL